MDNKYPHYHPNATPSHSSYYNHNPNGGNGYYSRESANYHSNYFPSPSANDLSSAPPTNLGRTSSSSYYSNDLDYRHPKNSSPPWSRTDYYSESPRYQKPFLPETYYPDSYTGSKRIDAPSSLPYPDPGSKYDYYHPPPSSSGYRSSSSDRYNGIPPPRIYPEPSLNPGAFNDRFHRPGSFQQDGGYDAPYGNPGRFDSMFPFDSDRRFAPSKLDSSRSRRWGRFDELPSANISPPVIPNGLIPHSDSPNKKKAFYWKTWGDSKFSPISSFKQKKTPTTESKPVAKPGAESSKKEKDNNNPAKDESKSEVEKEKPIEQEKGKEVAKPVEKIKDPAIELLVKNCLALIDYKINLSLIPLNLSWKALKHHLEVPLEESSKDSKGLSSQGIEKNDNISHKIHDQSVNESKIEKKEEKKKEEAPQSSVPKRTSQTDISDIQAKKKQKSLEVDNGPKSSETGKPFLRELSTPRSSSSGKSNPAPTEKAKVIQSPQPKTPLSQPSKQQSSAGSSTTKTSGPTAGSNTKIAPVTKRPSEDRNGAAIPPKRMITSASTSKPPQIQHASVKEVNQPRNASSYDVRDDRQTDWRPTSDWNMRPKEDWRRNPDDWNRGGGGPPDYRHDRSSLSALPPPPTLDTHYPPPPGFSHHPPGPPSKFPHSDLRRSSSADWREDPYRYNGPPSSIPPPGPLLPKYDRYDYDGRMDRYDEGASFRKREESNHFFPSQLPPPVDFPPHHLPPVQQAFPPIDRSRSWDGMDSRGWPEGRGDRFKNHGFPPYAHPAPGPPSSSQYDDYPNGRNMYPPPNGHHHHPPPSALPPPPRRDGNDFYDPKYYDRKYY